MGRKTSTLRMMIGITVPDSGRVLILGEPLSRAHTNRFGYLPEERGLYKKMKCCLTSCFSRNSRD